MSNAVTRYSDSELQEFRELIESKLEKAKTQYDSLIEQIKEITENSTGDFTKDLSDFSSSQTEVELLNSMATRQRTYIQDLQNALIRIRNKTYGICVITGSLIEKRRLLAVPTTTKSVIAKQVGEGPIQPPTPSRAIDAEDEDEEPKKKREAGPRKPVIITKVIKKPTAAPAKPRKAAEDDDDDELDEILKDLDNFGEEGAVEFDDDIEIEDEGSDDFDDNFDDVADEGGDDDED